MSGFDDARDRLRALAARTLPAAAPPVVEVRLPLRVVSEANARGSWHGGASRAARQRSTVALALQAHRRPALPVSVRLVRWAPRRLDGDNLQRACKAVRDAVAEWLGVDDADPRVSWHYAQGTARTYALGVIAGPRTWELVETPTGTVLRLPADGPTPGLAVEWTGTGSRAR